MNEGRITDEDIPLILETFLYHHLRKYVRDRDGSMRKEHVRSVIAKANEAFESFNETSEIDDNPAHYTLEGLLRRKIHRMGYIVQMEEATATAEGLKQYGAERVVLVTPYLEGRSDKDNFKGETNLSRKWATDFKVHGITDIITWRAHSNAQISFYTAEGMNFTQVYETRNQRDVLAQATVDHLVTNYGPNKIKENLVVIAPDKGAKEEAIEFGLALESILKGFEPLRSVLGPDYKVPVVVMRKNRGGKISEISDMGIEEWINIAKNTHLADRILVYRDDIIDTLGTNETALRTLGILPDHGYRKIGSGDVILVVDNPVLSTPATDVLKKIKKAKGFEVLISPRTIEPPVRGDEFQDTIKYLDIVPVFAEEILERES